MTIPLRSLTQLDDRLAKRTAEGFVDRLGAGETASAIGLFLTDSAREGDAGRLVSQFAGADPRLADADLLEFRRTTASSYEAHALLSWEAAGAESQAQQTMTLTLVPQRGLWLIDHIALGDRQAVEPTATPKRTTGTGRRSLRLDGRLVFQVSSGGEIYVINADGSGLRRLTDGLDPAWSPDGTQIAVSRWRHPWGVYLIDVGGADAPNREERAVDGAQLKEVAWSPGGSQLAFTVNYGSSEPRTICFFGFCFTIPPYSVGQIWTASLETGELLSLPLDDRVVHAPAWSPEGNRIVYAGERGLAWIDLDTMEKGRFDGGSVWDTSPAYSPDGQQIAFMGRVHNRWEIFGMNADGSGRQQLTSGDPKLDPPPSNVAPAWSPDGRYIAFLSNRDGPWRIYVMKANGSGQQPMFGKKLDELGLRYEWATERVLSWSR
jgi:Tol biopolymer transport system component